MSPSPPAVRDRPSWSITCEGRPRVGLFFAVGIWDGEVVNAEPSRCAKVEWAPIDMLPGNTVPYTATGAGFYRIGIGISVHGWSEAETTQEGPSAGTRRDKTVPLPAYTRCAYGHGEETRAGDGGEKLVGKHDDGKGPQDRDLDLSEIVHSPDRKRDPVGEHAGEGKGKDGGK
ncbi:hypothetical protein [Streptosporangium sp. NPDC006007]|uniref:hypothetical protein n=1 Tax=Streptosporangium sp. NPDC006007 TaxID=3154575 RepID=UPI0033AFACBD